MTRLDLSVCVLAILSIAGCSQPTLESTSVATRSSDLTVRGALSDEYFSDAFNRAIEPRQFEFPRDHGPHEGFRTEWWYFTGNLADESGSEFGYQITFFRQLLEIEPAQRTSDWATDSVLMGHFAVTDVAAERYHSFERFQREALDLAGASNPPLKVWLDHWELHQTSSNPIRFTILAEDGDVRLELELEATKPITLQGDEGLSQKGRGEGNASYYYSVTRLASSGRLTIDGKTSTISGNSWLDREWSTSALDDTQVGWDWFALQLDDGRDIMFYQLRKTDGARDPLSAGVLVESDGTKVKLDASDFELSVRSTWDSPLGGTYPAAWLVEIPKANLTLMITPKLADQEFDAVVRYWEGAVAVSSDDGVEGHGYVEMTGYAD